MRYFLSLISFLTIINKLYCTQEELDLGIEIREKDKLLACSELCSHKFTKDNKIIQDMVQSLPQVNSDRLTQKLFGDMLTSCYHRIPDNVVSTIFQNLNIVDVEWNDSYNNYLKVDYSKYRLENSDLEPTPEQQLLFIKINKIKEEFIVKDKERKEEEKSAFRILGFNIKSIPNSYKMVYFIVIFALFAWGILHFLGKVLRKEKKDKKKKVKKGN